MIVTRRDRRFALALGLALPLMAMVTVAAADDKPVEETKKNIQVLKGLPTSQLGPVMNAVSASLGVNCTFCHVVNGDKWEMEKDDKDEKKTARKMMQMVIDINKASFGGHPVISCNSCHRGSESPVGLVPLPVPAKAEATKEEEAEPTYPAAQEIVDKYVRAVGGADAAAKLKTLVMKGTREAQGHPMPLEVYRQDADKILVVATSPNGPASQGYNGKTGWVKNPRGQHELEAGELAQMRETMRVYDPIKMTTAAASMKVVATEKIGEKEAYVMRGEGANGTRLRFYFDKQSGLLLRSSMVTLTMIGGVPEQTDYDDYRDVGGVKLPYTIAYSSVDTWSSATRKFTEIKANVPIESGKFDPPGPAK